MKYAIIADIHANLEALEVVLDDIKAQGCSHVVCLGDVVGYNANPKECLDIIRGMNIPCVKGNHDEYCSAEVDLEGFNPHAEVAIQWTREQLSENDRQWLRDLHKQLGMTTVFVTHDQEEALELADRVVILNEGRIEQIGTPEEVYDHPATPYVLRFLGGANELPGHLRAGRIEVEGLDTSAIERIAAGDGAASLFVRPHDIDVQPADDGTASVRSVFITGAQAHVELTLAGQPLTADIRRDVARARGLKPGQRVRLKAMHGRLFTAPHAAAVSAPTASDAAPVSRGPEPPDQRRSATPFLDKSLTFVLRTKDHDHEDPLPHRARRIPTGQRPRLRANQRAG